MNKKNEPQKNLKIKTFVNMMFDDIPYSEEINEAQLKVEDALNEEFEKIRDGRHEDEILEELFGKYGKLSQMLELAGYPSNKAKRWREFREAVDIRSVKKEITKQRIRVYIIALFATSAITQLFWLIYNAITTPSAVIGTLIVIAVQLLIIRSPYRKYLRTEKAANGRRYDTKAYEYLRARSDKYAKRLLNSIALLFAMVFIFILSEIFFYFLGNSKSAEFAEDVMKNSIAVEIPVLILLKNILCLNIFQRRIKMPDISKETKQRGAELITIHDDSTWDLEQIPLDSIQ